MIQLYVQFYKTTFKKYWRFQMNSKIISLSAVFIILMTACDKKNSTESSTGQSYNFTSSANIQVGLNNSSLMATVKPTFEIDSSVKNKNLRTNETSSEVDELMTTSGPTLCSSVVCFTATSLTGRYYGVGFSIQSAGHGMVAYFGQDSWSSIIGTSQTYPFDASSPITNVGTLTCCNGTGDLSSSNTYIESVMYLFSYLDATFTVANVGSNTYMNQSFTVRFVFANDAITSGIRGDILIKDLNLPPGQGGSNDGLFKWVSSASGTLSTTRPADPVTMDSKITNYVNPFGEHAGNSSIPVIYAGVISTGGGLYTVNESDLKVANRTYNFNFDAKNLIMFPKLQTTDINSLFSVKALMQNIHLGGLPHSFQPMGVGSPASTTLISTSL
jgi:hypothetical protein